MLLFYFALKSRAGRHRGYSPYISNTRTFLSSYGCQLVPSSGLTTIKSALLLFSSYGCVPEPEPEPKTVDHDKLVQRQYITYEINSTIPFTGRGVRAYHKNGQIRRQSNYKNGSYSGNTVFAENGQIESLTKSIETRHKIKKGTAFICMSYAVWIDEDYYSNGQLSESKRSIIKEFIPMNDGTGQSTGLQINHFKEFDLNGNLTFERCVEGRTRDIVDLAYCKPQKC